MSESGRVQRRFIAGAVCPECQVSDRIVVETAVAHVASEALDPALAVAEGELPRRRCVACGFTEAFDATGQSVGGIPRGRAERPQSPQDVPASAVRILDPGAEPDD